MPTSEYFDKPDSGHLYLNTHYLLISQEIFNCRVALDYLKMLFL